MKLVVTLGLIGFLHGAVLAQAPEATSLFGKPLVSVPPTGEQKARLEADLAKAQAAYDRDPSSADAAIWLGRRLAYLGRFNDAITAYSRGIERHPNEARLYRHRGHRYVTIRKFDLAIADLRRATQLIAGKPDEVEPDGAPNKAGIPRSTLQSNIWYHLGLAQYLKGDFGINLPHYASREYDGLLDAAAQLVDVARRRRLLEQAERLALADHPLIPLYFYVNKHLVKPEVRGWYNNVMNVYYSQDFDLIPTSLPG